MRQKGFDLIYDTEISNHLSVIPKKYHFLIKKEIEIALRFEPEKETKNRKPLVNSFLFDMDWELRCGEQNEFRVFYRTNSNKKEVYILAIGVKKKNKLTIGKTEITL